MCRLTAGVGCVLLARQGTIDDKWIAPIFGWLAAVGVISWFRASIDRMHSVGHIAAQAALVPFAGLLIDLTLRAYI